MHMSMLARHDKQQYNWRIKWDIMRSQKTSRESDTVLVHLPVFSNIVLFRHEQLETP